MRCWMLLGALLLTSACGDKDCDPDAVEICNNQDDNCNGETDEGLAVQAYYADGDSDGYGTSLSTVQACALPPGYATSGDDCDDQDAAVSPSADEICDGADNDCDGATDAQDGTLTGGVTGYIDEDGDGFGGAPGFSFCTLPSGFTDIGGDCDDFDIAVTTGRLWYLDADSDGYGDANAALESCSAPGEDYVTDAGDCDDADGAVNPGKQEICEDGLDNNCDGTGGDCAPLSGDLTTSDADATIEGESSYAGRWISSADLLGSSGRSLVIGDPDAFNSLGLISVFGPLSTGDELQADEAVGQIEESVGSNNGSLGFYAVALDDLTGDGIDDVIAMSESGLINVFDDILDGASAVDDAAFRLYGLDSSYDLEAGVLGGGDFDGDGAADLLIGDPFFSDTQPYQGQVFLVHGPITADLDLTQQPTLYGDISYNAQLGFHVMDGGDTNGDGIHEVLVSARRSSLSGLGYSGAVYLMEGVQLTSDFNVNDSDTVLLGTASSGYFGQDVGAASDVNDDGYDDVIVGAYSGGSGGMAYVFNGPFDSILEDDSADTIISSDSSGDYLGWRVAMAGDLNDDGIDDIAYTELLSSYGVSSGGAVGIVYGPLDATYSLATTDAVIVPTSAVYLGHDIAGVGDVNGDGVDDLAMSAYNDDMIWVFFGGSGI